MSDAARAKVSEWHGGMYKSLEELLDVHNSEQTAALREQAIQCDPPCGIDHRRENMHWLVDEAARLRAQLGRETSLREENARLREALFDLVEYAKSWRLDVEAAPMHAALALLADPEGQS